MSLKHCQKWSTKVRFSQIMEMVAIVACVTLQEMVVYMPIRPPEQCSWHIGMRQTCESLFSVVSCSCKDTHVRK